MTSLCVSVRVTSITTGVDGLLQHKVLLRASWSLFLRYLSLIIEKMIPLFAPRSLSTISAVLGDHTNHNDLETRPIDNGSSVGGRVPRYLGSDWVTDGAVCKGPQASKVVTTSDVRAFPALQNRCVVTTPLQVQTTCKLKRQGDSNGPVVFLPRSVFNLYGQFLPGSVNERLQGA